MSQTVLVIDSNSAVQAITTLALNQSDCHVETLADGSQAYQRIRSLKPTVVLCAKELAGIDPFELCRQIKSESQATAFVLLAPADAVQQTARQAAEARYDEVLYKPFKSNRLREVVTALIQRGAAATTDSPIFLVALQDSLRKKIIEAFLGKNGCQVIAELKPELAGSTLALIDAGSPPPSGVSPKNVYTAVAGADTERPNQVAVPLTLDGMRKAFGTFLTERALTIPVAEPASAANSEAHSTGEQSEFAAEISAHIFRRLLTSPAVARRNLKETAQIVQDELKKIAHTFGWDR